MKVLLVLPRQEIENYRPKRPVLGLGYLAAILEKEHEVRIFDNRLKDLNFESVLQHFNPDFVLFTLTAMTLKNAYRLIKIVKSKTNAVIICGGPEVTLLPKNILQNKDINFIICGEGEHTLLDFVNKYSSGKNFGKIPGLGFRKNNELVIKPFNYIGNLDNLPFPAWHLFPLKNYNRRISNIKFPVLTSRGCPFQCIYCDSSRINHKYRVRSSKNVVDEIEYVHKKYGCKNFQVIDDNFALITKRVFDICKEIINRNLKIKWVVGQGLNTRAANLEMFKIMKKAGCVTVSMGVESSDPEILKLIKKPSTKEEIIKAFTLAKKAGLKTKAHFICGLPGATYKKEMDYIRFFKKLDVDIPRFGNLMVFPNTEVYDWAKKNAKPLVDLYTAHESLSQCSGTLNVGENIQPVFETPEFTREERIKSFKICNSEADKWALKNLFGWPFGIIAWRLSRIKRLRYIGERILDYLSRF